MMAWGVVCRRSRTMRLNHGGHVFGTLNDLDRTNHLFSQTKRKVPTKEGISSVWDMHARHVKRKQ